jgi:SAM-dependent methyltransferase
MSAMPAPPDRDGDAAPSGKANVPGDDLVTRYTWRDADPALAARYDPLRPEVLHARQVLERAITTGVRQRGLVPSALDVLDVGCGHGDPLLGLLRLGFDPARLQGVDLLPARLAGARQRLPAAVRLHAGDAAALALPAASLDLVLQFTVFSSVLDPAARQQLAAAIWRWLRPGGSVLWFDLAWPNPRNPEVLALSPAAVQQLFPQGRVQARRLTVAPPLARGLARVHPALLPLAHALPWLRGHWWVWVDKPAVP